MTRSGSGTVIWTNRRYYPSTRARLTRALDEGVKEGLSGSPYRAPNPFSYRNSGLPLWRAYFRGRTLTRGFDPNPRHLPVVDLSAEFADMIREVEPEIGARLGRGT